MSETGRWESWHLENKALSLGCKKGDLVHDQSKGYLIIAQA